MDMTLTLRDVMAIAGSLSLNAGALAFGWQWFLITMGLELITLSVVGELSANKPKGPQ